MQPGTMLAHYRIEEKIGQGGMGAVYRASDTVLDRDVAVKILPPEFAVDGERLARFQREAKVLASLHHPNIASIFGFEHTADCTYLVMELVEGEDLAEILKRGPLAVDEAVDVARQIAEGLEEAHEKGIIHRDLKPANVKRSPDGRVKVLDFGLARAYAGQTAGEGHVSSAPTMTAAMTLAGTVMGTAAYMSPEQARGKEMDRRTDIWAFGVILFEMLTGKQLFAGETASDSMAGILKTEPEWSKLPAGLPPQVEQVLRRCLSKDPRQRLRDIGEARVRLEDPYSESGMFSGAVSAVSDSARSPLRLLPWALAALGLATATWFVLGRGPAAVERPVTHLAMPAPPTADFAVNGSYPGLPVVSPTGTHIVFSAKAVSDATVQLYVRALDSGRAVALDGTVDAQYPFWSPDGQWIAFFDRNEGLKKIPVGGGPTQTICAAGNGKGGSWNEAGEIIFAPEYNASLQVVAAVGGTPRTITEVEQDAGFDSHRHPQFMPDGHHFLYMARGAGGQDTELRLADLDGGAVRTIMKLDTGAQYASGHLLYLNQQTLMAQPFDPTNGSLSGTPVPVAEDVMIIAGAAKGAFAASNEGTLVYLRGKAEVDATLNWLDLKGNDLGTVGDRGAYDTVVLSPDNRRAAVTVMDRVAGTGDIWILEIERNFRTRFTSNPADEAYPVWQPDGRALLFVSDRTGKHAVYRKELGGTGDEERLLELPEPIILWDCVDDGHTILYSIDGGESQLDLWAADLTGQSEPRLLRRSPESDGAAQVSPDGRWIVFWSEESGRGQVYLAPWPAMSPLTQVSTTSGTWSYWHADSRSLVYSEGGGRLLKVDLTPQDGEMRIGAPQTLFDHAPVSFDGPFLDWARDGERFLAVNSAATDPPAFCEVVIGWPQRLKP